MSESTPNVFVLGGGGYIGYECIKRMANDRTGIGAIVCGDIREIPQEHRFEGVEYEIADVTQSDLAALFSNYEINTVINLASIVNPGQNANLEYQVDVVGAQRVLDACVESGVTQLVYTSSGAAYGYYADNPEWLDENDPLRGNVEFSYSDHKRIVEDKMKEFREQHPSLKQLIFRPGTVLGERTENRITNLFGRPTLVGVNGTDTPFVFIWDQDVADAVVKGTRERAEGIYNLVGDGVVTFPQIAQMTGAKFRPLPAWLLRTILAIGKGTGLTDYGPEQVMFLQYRPCMSNKRLKDQFGFTPAKTSMEAFEFYLEHAKKRGKI